jgi:hypothetical protein
MKSASLLLVGLLFLAIGCGKESTPPAASTHKRGFDRLADEAGQTYDRNSRQVRQDFDDLAAETERTVKHAKKSLTKEAKKHRDDLAEFAAQMAEDAKDRAMDIPDVMDEFFGTPGQYTRDARRRSRSE